MVDQATKVDPVANEVHTARGDLYGFDYAVVATGFALDWSIRGLGPDGFSQCICTPSDALGAREAFARLVAAPGPAVVGATQRAGCIGTAYEFLFNLEFHLRRRGVRGKVSLTWVTPEPFLGHFGIGGLPHAERLLLEFCEHLGIHVRTNAAVDHVEPEVVELASGERLESAFTMLVPPFVGQKVIAASDSLGNASALVTVRDTYQHVRYPHIFAAGATIDVPAPFNTPVALGVPKTGYPADTEAKIVAENIRRLVERRVDLRGVEFGQIPGLCVMDAGHKEVVIIANHLFEPREHSVLLPNPLYDEGKRLFERYYLWKVRHGHMGLP